MTTQLSFSFQPTNWTVSEITRYVRRMFDTDYRLHDISIDGQLSNLSKPRSGHLYFTLKDDKALLQCVMWRDKVARMTYHPQDGDHVLARGHLSVYEAGGRYQLYAEELQLSGFGDSLKQLEELKRKLAAEGLFDQDRKRSLPRLTRNIAVVTSATGAAIKDVLNVVERRWPLAHVLVFPTAVQGESANDTIVAALSVAIRHRPDVILLVRGGGSIEDIWAFNDESVVRAIAASEIPVVTGVGHETDLTLADLAADVRAPTPSAAAEISTPEQREMRLVIDQRLSLLSTSLKERIRSQHSSLVEFQMKLESLSPITRLGTTKQDLARLDRRRNTAMRHTLRLRAEQMHSLTQILSNLGPDTTLARGYAIVTHAHTTDVVHRGTDIKLGEELDIRVSEGQFGVRVSRPETEG